jgi:hypothetical protein
MTGIALTLALGLWSVYVGGGSIVAALSAVMTEAFGRAAWLLLVLVALALDPGAVDPHRRGRTSGGYSEGRDVTRAPRGNRSPGPIQPVTSS